MTELCWLVNIYNTNMGIARLWVVLSKCDQSTQRQAAAGEIKHSGRGTCAGALFALSADR